MPDEAGAQKVEDPATPVGSPPPKVDENGTSTQTPADGAKTTEGKVPFNEIMANPDFQDYFSRQLKKGVQEELSRMNVPPPPKSEDKMEQIAAEIAEENGITVQQARGLVKKFSTIAQMHLEPIQGTMQDQQKSVALNMRTATLRSKDADVAQIAPKMLKMLNSLKDEEKMFVFNSDDGVEWLYAKAKNGQVIVSPITIAGAGSTAGRSVSPIAKIGDDTAREAAISNALASGNRVEFDRLVKATPK